MIEETAHAKINLALRILNRRVDGYHDIDTVFQSVALSDTVLLETADDIQVTCTDPHLPCDETNLAYRAALALQPYCKRVYGVHIHITKRIPLAAGLGGGSSDCAAVLRGLNKLWELGLSYNELRQIGAGLGADVPFCIRGGTDRGTGRGDVLTALPDFPDMTVVIIHPHLEIHTHTAYAKFDAATIEKVIDINDMEQAAHSGSAEDLINAMGNTFEELVIPDYPKIKQCKDVLEQHDLKPMMSGSGPTVFAVVPTLKDISMQKVLDGVMNEADVFVSRFTKGEGFGNEQ